METAPYRTHKRGNCIDFRDLETTMYDDTSCVVYFKVIFANSRSLNEVCLVIAGALIREVH